MSNSRPSTGGNRHRIVEELLPSFEKTATTGVLTHYKNFRAADLWAPTHAPIMVWHISFRMRRPRARNMQYGKKSTTVTMPAQKVLSSTTVLISNPTDGPNKAMLLTETKTTKKNGSGA